MNSARQLSNLVVGALYSQFYFFVYFFIPLLSSHVTCLCSAALDNTNYAWVRWLFYVAGHTRTMLEYFRTIGFPCPELENPLMYYCELSFFFSSRFKTQQYVPTLLVVRYLQQGREECKNLLPMTPQHPSNLEIISPNISACLLSP